MSTRGGWAREAVRTLNPGYFAVVMATSVLAAVRRWTGHLRRAVAPPPQLKRRDVA